MQNAKKAYMARKAAKVAKKAAEREAFKEKQALEAKNELEKNTRKPEDIEIDLDATSSCLGSLYHQKEIIDYELRENTKLYSGLLVEYHKSKEVWDPKPEIAEKVEASDVPQAEA